jgi:hypothetical protein
MPRPAQAADPVQPVPYTTSQPVPYAAPSTAPAPPPTSSAVPAAGNDVVVLKNGGMIRGTLLEIIPNDHATVQLATGQNAIISWDQVHHIERGSAAQVKATPAPVVEEATVRLHIESDRQVTLERHEVGNTWSVACTSPCDADVGLKQEYRITGSGLRTSTSFRIAARPGEHVTVDVNAGTKAGLAGGIVFVSLGPLAMFIGLIVVAVANASESFTTYNGSGTATTGSRDHSGAATTGWIITACGAGATVGGIFMIVGSKTTVELSTQKREKASIDGARLPTWHDDRSPLRGPTPFNVPLLSGTF